jgi:hypothetical protein
MWRVTWQTGVAYIIFGAIYLSAYRTLVTPDWNRWSVATLAAIGVLGWALLLTGCSFLIATMVKRVRRASGDSGA